MRRDQLEHAIRAACQIIGQPEVIVVGSQAILGTYDESQLPAAATMSIEVDVLPIADSNEATALLADRIEGIAGELSPFEEIHGCRRSRANAWSPARPRSAGSAHNTGREGCGRKSGTA
jgi:hypothetical protein